MAKNSKPRPAPQEGEIIDKDSAKVKKAVRHVIAEMHSGPLPAADDFAAYEKVHKGAANRIIKMAEKALGAEVFAVRADKITEFVAMLLSRAFLYALLGGAIYLAMNDKPAEAAIAGLAPVISVIYSTFKQPEQNPPKKKKSNR